MNTNLPTRNNPVQLDFQRLAKPLKKSAPARTPLTSTEAEPRPCVKNSGPAMSGFRSLASEAFTLTDYQKTLLIDGIIIITWFTLCMSLFLLV